jgi:hypothetical protein
VISIQFDLLRKHEKPFDNTVNLLLREAQSFQQKTIQEKTHESTFLPPSMSFRSSRCS